MNFGHLNSTFSYSAHAGDFFFFFPSGRAAYIFPGLSTAAVLLIALSLNFLLSSRGSECSFSKQRPSRVLLAPEVSLVVPTVHLRVSTIYFGEGPTV